jgi:spore maturation protein CgeB
MRSGQLDIAILGLSMTSSWGNGHATTYRGLVRALIARGHRVVFLERDMPWYAAARDLPDSLSDYTVLYNSAGEIKTQFAAVIRNADLVIVGSYVPDGIELGNWVIETARGITAFYDIDTPITLAMIKRGEAFYLSADLIPRYDLYLSFTGGPILQDLEKTYRSPMARALYCGVDTDLYRPLPRRPRWNLGYMGTYSEDRQALLDELLLQPARLCCDTRMVVAGPQYPDAIDWPTNVERIEHLPPSDHAEFYSAQNFTLNVTRASMVHYGYSPSIRLFEAAACGCPIISDWWEGLDTFFDVDKEILVARSAETMLTYLVELGANEREAIGQRARRRVLAQHTAMHRAAELESYALELL